MIGSLQRFYRVTGNMPAIFVHVSDIHFGQERDERIHIHTDVKDQLIADAAEVVRGLPGGIAHGILATGDIAQAGRREQYEQAGEWLDRLAKAIGCEIFRIQMVPGNHDLDRDKLSMEGGHLLDVVKNGGPSDYEKILANETDRAALFARFEAYGRFSEGYDCALDTEGKFATNLHVELAPGRSVRFIRINSALLCTGNETEEVPELMIGARQFPIPRNEGEENVVLIHHPLHWSKDSEDARTYLRSRARVLISGHEHNPKVSIDKVEEGCDLMMLAAGATVPFKNLSVNNVYVQFDFSERHDGCRQVVECQEATIKFLIPHQELSESVEPTVRDFDNPASCFFLRVAFEFAGLLSSAFDMRNVAMFLNDFQGRCAGITCVGAQMFVPSQRWIGSLDFDVVEHGFNLRNIMPVCSGHDEGQRDATAVHQQMALAALFFPDQSGWARLPLAPAAL